MWKSKAKNLAFLKLSDSIKYNIIYENKGNQKILYRSLRRVVKPRLHYEAISCCAYALHPGNHYCIARKTPRPKEIFTIRLANQIPAELAESVQLIAVDKLRNTQENT